MRLETKKCQNCEKEFVIEPEDFAFYEKIKVPAPTWCPECRFQRRLAFLNLFHLFSRTCDLCKKEVLSIYPKDAPYTVYCPTCWWSDKWDWSSFGRDYDFSRPFFEQFNELLHAVPHISLYNDLPTLINSSYVNFAGRLKNAYLLFMADAVENAAYGFYLNHVKDSLDSSAIVSSELCYDSMHSYKNSRCAGLRSQVTESVDCAFLRDSFNSQNCTASANLRNKKYYIFNKPYTKETYVEEMKNWDLGSYKKYQELKKLAEEHWKTLPPKPAQLEFSVNSSGSHVFQSRNCKDCFEVIGAEDSRYLFLLYDPPTKDCYDISTWGNNLALSYECCNVGEHSSGLKFSMGSGINLYDAEYAFGVLSSSHVFGSAWVTKGEYVIFNKQYPKEEYEALRKRIIKHMDEMPYRGKDGITYQYGEFFPTELSPHAYNQTVAHYFFPLAKGAIEARGYKYREIEIRKHNITMKNSVIPDHIKDAEDSILKEVLECGRCGRGFRIIPMELQFLQENNFSLPRKCPFCRIEEKFEQWVRDLRMLPRTCNQCGARFETKYTEEESPLVYCMECYQAEII